MEEHRRFIRHPSDVPIEFTLHEGEDGTPAHVRDVSLGGLAFEADVCPDWGRVVEVRIPAVEPEFRTRGRVVWCRKQDSVYEVGVEFLEASDLFKARMVEQVCHIEQYKRDVLRREGRRLSGEEAAREWIGRHAATFPDPMREARGR